MASAGVMRDFGRLPTGRKVLIFGVIAFLMGLIYFKFAYKGLKADVEAAQARHQIAVKQNDTLEKDIPKFADLRARKDELDGTIREMQKALPTEAEVPAFFETLERKVTETGVDYTKWTKRAEEPIDAFVKVSFDVEITGTFMQVKRFFASLVEKKQKREAAASGQEEGKVEERERVVSIENLQILQPTIRNRELILTAKFTAVTFRQADKAPAAPGSPASSLPPAPADGPPAPELPPANTPKGAKVRVEDSLKKGEQRDTLKPEPSGSGSARLKGGM